MAEIGSEPVFRIDWEGLNLSSLGCLSWQVSSQFLGVSDTWTADIHVAQSNPLRPADFLMCPVTLSLDGATILQGRCEWVETGTSPELYRVGGFDYLHDLMVCDTDPALIVSEGDTLEGAILKACGPVGITSMIADGGFALRTLRCGQPIGRKKTKVAPGEVKMQDLKPHPGRSLAEWVGHLASRHGLTLQPGTQRGQIALQAPDYETPPIGTISRSFQYANESNIITARARRDASRLPTCCLMTNQAGSSAEGRDAGLTVSNVAQVLTQWIPEATGASNRAQGARRKPGTASSMPDGGFYRLMFHQDKEARNADQLLRDAARSVAERLKDTLQYQATVRGFRGKKGGALYATDTMLTVADDVNDVNEALWVCGRTFSNGPGGPRTALQMWRPGSFQIG
jgi:prophage tail gpP-like protein